MRLLVYCVVALLVYCAGLPAFSTTIAWDGVNLAADTQVTNGHRALKTKTKIFYSKQRKAYIGLAGDVAKLQKIEKWFESGLTDTFAMTGEFQALYITEDGVCRFYDHDMGEYVVMEQAYAIGTGSDFALAFMYIGKTAKEAVRLTSDLDIYTNSKVTSFRVVK